MKVRRLTKIFRQLSLSLVINHPSIEHSLLSETLANPRRPEAKISATLLGEGNESSFA